MVHSRDNHIAEERVAVVGLGYVGLPLAIAFAEAGLSVTGFDISDEHINALNCGQSPIGDISDDILSRHLSDGHLRLTTDATQLRDVTAILICVPTPLKPTRDPDLSMIESAAEIVRNVLRPGQLVVLESTTYPGTTDEVLRQRLEASGLKAGEDFNLGYSPERIDPGSTSSSGFDLRNTPKIVSGVSPACLKRVERLYRSIVDHIVPVSSPRVAEMAKLYENVFRVVNVAMANEMALLCDRMHLDVWEVLEAAGTKPFGYMKFLPGPGVGGHCIPVDPFYLTWKAREYEFNTKFIELAGEINLSMPRHVVELTARALNLRQKSLLGSRILILGVAYKPDIPDVRESPALRIIDLLQDAGAVVKYHDPHVPSLDLSAELRGECLMSSVDLTETELRRSDCVVLVTDHTTFDLKMIVEHSDIIVDTRNALKGRQDSPATIITL